MGWVSYEVDNTKTNAGLSDKDSGFEIGCERTKMKETMSFTG